MRKRLREETPTLGIVGPTSYGEMAHPEDPTVIWTHFLSLHRDLFRLKTHKNTFSVEDPPLIPPGNFTAFPQTLQIDLRKPLCGREGAWNERKGAKRGQEEEEKGSFTQRKKWNVGACAEGNVRFRLKRRCFCMCIALAGCVYRVDLW